MRQRQLEILLERVRPFPSPKAEMEQYSLPAPAAAALLHFDLGCGTGILAIGAKLLGARRAVGVDRDREALAVARENAGALGVEVEWVEADVAALDPAAHRADTVLMNPPFGAQRRGADRPFLRLALKLAPVAYGFGNRGSEEFVKRFISPARLTATMSIDIPLKRSFAWHREESRDQRIELYRMER
jgi:putative methylase